MSQFFSNLSLNRNLKIIDLYNNDLSQFGEQIDFLLKQNRSLEAILLRKTNINSKLVANWPSFIGRQEIEMERVEEVKKHEKEKEQIIAKNQKLKKAQ